MNIKNHIIEGIPFRKSPNVGGKLSPTILTIHFDASKTAEGAISWMTSPKSKVSAHLSISREGKVVQLVPFNVVAWHAGESVWRGVKGLNSHSIGIELTNTGSQEYTEIQLQALYEVSKLLIKEYSLKEVVGHSDISPVRKTDPSGVNHDLFNWVEYNSNVCLPVKAMTTTSDLNMRVHASTDYKVIQLIPKGSQVYEISNIGSWSKIQYGKKVGYVANRYLTT